MSDTWWKNAIFYGVDVERFHDSNGDGIGDFRGLTEKLPYIADLGVTCIWLLPFFPALNRDNGYAINDYFSVDPKYGSFSDFLDFVHQAGEHGIRVIIDLVMEHTSNEHPWFQAGRHDPQSRFRDYYIWADHPPPAKPGEGPIFPGEENTLWSYDEVARAYYYHCFYHFQPSLNHQNPAVWEEIRRIVDYWLSFGIAGFRIDAVPLMVDEPPRSANGEQPGHEPLRQFFRWATERKPDLLLLGEVEGTPDTIKSFFEGGKLHMILNFYLCQHLFLAMADERSEPASKSIARLPSPPEYGQWANFLRNLDELTVERLPEDEKQRVFAAFAPKEEMRIYDRGVRRRLASMFDGDIRRLKLAFALLFGVPGAPVFVYGDELGMGDDLSQPGRAAVRSPMQWSSDRNGGFSAAPEDELVQPAQKSGPLSFKKINVASQKEDEASLLSFVSRLSALRRRYTVIGERECRFLNPGSEHVLALGYGKEEQLILLHNLKGKSVRIDIELEGATSAPTCLLRGSVNEPESGRLRMELEPYGVRWLAMKAI